MLKFDKLGMGPKFNKDSRTYLALLNNVRECDVKLTLDSVDPVYGKCRIRRAGAGLVAEGHCALKLAKAAEGIAVESCVLDLTTTLEWVIPEGAKKLDLSDLFGAALEKADVKADGVALVENATVADGVITLSTAAPAGGVKITIEDLVLATNAATTDNNAVKVNLDAGDYQVHFITRVHDDLEHTRMPNPSMMEFIKHCSVLNVHA